MRRRIELNAKVIGGKLVFHHEALANTMLKSIEGEPIVVQIIKAHKTRSGEQNGWYWGCVLSLIAEHTGDSVYELHEVFKRMFLPPVTKEFAGKTFRMPGSTAELSKPEFYEYVERIRAFAAQELGINVPDPQ
jgi:AraC-like DNA-binding protein